MIGVRWKKLHREEDLHSLFSTGNIRVTESRWMRWAWYVARMEKKNAYGVLARKTERDRLDI
jgi:hypothetical protein